jgi:hypothetical protein
MSTQLFPKKQWIVIVLLAFALLLGVSAIVRSPSAIAGPVPTPVKQIGPLSPGPDLVIESITLDPAAPELDEEFDINVRVKNQGDTDVTTSFRVYLYVDPVDQPPTDTTPDTSWTSMYGLNAGASYNWTRMGETFTTGGCHDIYAWVDKTGAVAEDDEGNNVAHIRVCIGDGDGDPYEPDNPCEMAKPITTDGTTQTHNLAPVGDVDWVKFDAVANVTYVIEALNVGADANVVLSLFSQCGAPPCLGGGQRIEWTAPVNGTFYVKVEHHDDTYDAGQSEYTLSVTAQDDCANDAYEVDNTCTAARDISTAGSVQRHLFCSSGDVDWVKFSAMAGVTYTIQGQNVGAGADVVLSLFDRCGVPPGFGGGQRIEWVCPADGTYYVKAENHDPARYGAAITYDLSISGGGGCTPDDFEVDDAAASARPIAVDGAAQTHTFCPAGDRDWVQFNAASGTRYTIETSSLGSESDTFVALYGTDGTTLIAWDDDSGPGLGSRITWDCPAGGTYYIKVRHYNPQAAGADTRYDLTVSTVPCQPDAYEQDNTYTAARGIPTDGSTQDRNFCGAGDVDWAKFVAQAGVNYVIKTSGLGPSCDTVIHLYASDGVTQLAANDDYGSGMGSRIDFVFSTSDTYYVKVRHYNAGHSGAGTEYKISVKQGSEPTPTPTPTVTPTPTPTPPPSEVKTLILVNRERVAHHHGDGAANSLMAKLNDLSQHDLVRGVVVQVENNGAVAQAYVEWDTELTSTEKANAVAGAVRNLVLSYLDSIDSIEYVVIVGDDRIIPFRRTLDRTNHPEHHYESASRSTTVGAACDDDMTLTDDYYVDREPIWWNGHEVYLPDLAIGRLIETPSEIEGLIDEFIDNNGQTNVSKVLVTGYDFVRDAAREMADLLCQDVGPTHVDDGLIGGSWSGGELRDKQLHTSPRFDVQSINGHANHWTEGAPGSGNCTAGDVVGATSDLGGVLIYALGCHAGLNVPPDNDTHPLDLAQAFLGEGASYVANTGFGWGVRGLVGLSERLMIDFTRAFLTHDSATIGKALTAAKQAYYQQATQFSDHDEKVLIESTLYGLPMYQLNTGAVLGDEDPFAGDVTFQAGGQALPLDEDLLSGTVGFSLKDSFVTMPIESHPDGFGNYYSLSGYISTGPLEPTQPLYFRELEPPAGRQVRGLIMTSASYTDTTGFDPVIGLAENEFVTSMTEPDYDAVGWHPAVPFGLFRPNRSNPEATLLFSMGQYDIEGQTERLYDGAHLDVYYSGSPDYLEPTVRWVGGVRAASEGKAYVKIEAMDSSGIQRVNVAYTDGTGQWRSQDLSYDSRTQKWFGSFPATADTVCFVQVVDRAGNVAVDTNKGSYYRFATGEPPSLMYWVYLPVVTRGR